jgi:glycosyltransferase involved in cell wall biosynthesis
MVNKIKVLFLNKDSAGVNYYRTQTPAIELENLYGEEFDVDIESAVDFTNSETVEKLKQYDIIHYHSRLVDNVRLMYNIKNQLPNVKFVMDIDDYWFLDKKHPLYAMSVKNKTYFQVIENLKIADYVTTTTEYFAKEIKNITKKDNVFVLYNSVNPNTMTQFENNWKPDPNGKIRITYVGGSSHLGDLDHLSGVINVLNADVTLKNKFIINLAGWDTKGDLEHINFNEEFIDALKSKNLLTKENIKLLNKSNGNVDMINKLPNAIKDKFRNNVYIKGNRPITSEESIYFAYEKILTDNHRIIKNKDYYNWLMSFSKNKYYGEEDIFIRTWTQKANLYAKVLDNTDIVIAPLDNNKFNMMKSNLKQIECWSRKLPIVCSDMIPYNVDGKHLENCILIPTEKNQKKDWVKWLKKLILDSDLRKKLGEQLYLDFNEKYNSVTVTKTRRDLYKAILNV